MSEQIVQYSQPQDMQALPAVFMIWAEDYVRPGMEDVFNVPEVYLIFVDAFLTAAARGNTKPRFLSLGCGDGAVEIQIATALEARGIGEFTFVCADLSDVLLDRFRAAIPPALAKRFELVQGDLNTTTPDSRYDAIMANHSLHHIADLERVYQMVWDSLAPHGIFATADMIGRNGHMRWDETRLFVGFIWPFLTPKQRSNVLLQRDEMRFLDHDCSVVGFEGIRAQEVLPLLLRQGFQPSHFFSFGGMVDPFVDRCFGPNFDSARPDDAFLMRRISWLNETLLNAGVIKPTMMMAWFEKQPVEERCYRGRTAADSVRDLEASPPWLENALADLALYPDDEAFVFRKSSDVAD